ncbi:AAA family ATPase [Actinoplanes solisilvae]|uniref:AAA family ATPase n=1 Tax=Actinoplanes solisilvae TaxID=2486853 RepID=UPI000FD6E5D9|nr:AAA family ATPase [Actinoplanes solisilvae]
MGAEGDAPGLIGHGAMWARLKRLLSDRNALVLTGDAGVGKTALLGAFAETAVERGHRVSRVAGDSGMPRVAYAALRALLADADPDALPAAQGRALRAALAGAETGVDLLILRAAVCAALDQLAGDRPLVLVVDDVDRVDAPSLDVLLTLASVISVGQMPMVALFAARTDRVPIELAELLEVLVVPPLSEREAERLFEAVPDAPAGVARLEILRRAAGNPLALREYAGGAVLPGDGGVADVYARRVEELPERTKWALTLVAAGERELAIAAEVWQPAVDAGLISVTDTAVHFRHPLVEFAVLRAAGAAAERRAHRLLAERATDSRRALWHRAAAATGHDPELANELVQAAELLDGAGVVTAVTMLEQAAGLLKPEHRAPVLLGAAARAGAVGRLRWATGILERAEAVLDLEATPGFDVNLAVFGAWLQTMRGRLDAAVPRLTWVIEAEPLTAGTANSAAFPSFLLGRGALTGTLARATADLPVDQPWLFPLVVTRPSEEVREGCLLAREASSLADQDRATVAGAAAMLADEPEHALRLLAPAVSGVIEGKASGVFLAAPGAAGWAMIDLGRWIEAEHMLVPLLSSPVGSEATLIRAGTYAQLAVIAYLRGRCAAADELLARSPMDPQSVPVFALRLAWARGLAAAASGEHERAYESLAVAFAVPHDWQVLVLPDLVAAATEAGVRNEAEAAVRQAEEAYGMRWLSARARGRMTAARALLDDDLPTASAVLAGVRNHPFERAALAVAVADRLRRDQQPRVARDLLIDALDGFERLGAAGWAGRVFAQLRGGAPAADPFAGLSPQQEQIVRLAAGGMSNREIGERLFLSPRTIGSHLYRIFPQLGIANRTQLGELLAGRGGPR